jgi:hypothetical protein
MSSDPDLAAIISTVEEVTELEEDRRQTLRDEFDAYADDQTDSFERTRAVVDDERARLADLADLLDAEADHIADLEDVSSYLSVDQAVRNRDEALTKLRSHNAALWEFHDHLAAGLDAVSANLDALADGDPPSSLPHDADDHLEDARAALETHNDAVSGLGKNLRILTSYMR